MPNPVEIPAVVMEAIERVEAELARVKAEYEQLDHFYRQMLAAASRVPTEAPSIAPVPIIRETADKGIKPTGEPRLKRFTPNRSSEEMQIAIRDWVIAQGNRIFNNKDLAKAIGINSATYAGDKLKPLLDAGTVVLIPPKNPRGQKHYKYAGKPPITNPVRPTVVPDIDPRKLPPSPARHSTPVEGTGHKSNLTASMPKDVASLLDSVRAQITLTARADGHIRMMCKRTGNFHDISASPSDVNAVHQIRRDLQRIGVYVTSAGN